MMMTITMSDDDGDAINNSIHCRRHGYNHVVIFIYFVLFYILVNIISGPRKWHHYRPIYGRGRWHDSSNSDPPRELASPRRCGD